jgi:hypothetical protein
MPSVFVCLYVPSLAHERLDRYYSRSKLKSLSIIGRCPVNMNILPSKAGALNISPKNKMAIFSKYVLTIYIEFQ